MSYAVQQFLMQVAQVSIIPLVGALVTILVQRIQLQRQDISAKKQQLFELIYRKAVRSTKQQFKSAINPTDAERMAFAMGIAKRYAKEQHLKVNDLTLEDRLEGEVWEVAHPDPPVVIAVPQPVIGDK